MKFFLFELKKIAWTKKYLIIIAVLICSVAFLFIRNVFFEEFAIEQRNKEIVFFIDTSTSKNNNYNRQLEQLDGDEEIEEKKELNLLILKFANDLRSAVLEHNWEKELFVENQLVLAIRDYKATGEDYPLSESDIDYTLALNHTLLDLGIPPEYENYSTAYPNFLKQVVDVFINYGGLIIVLLLIGEILTREFENKSINLLFTLPLKRSQLIWSKFFSGALISIFAFAIIIVAGYTIGKIFGTEGSFAYPILIEKAEGFYYITILQYLFIVILLFMASLLFVISLYLFYSLILKHLLASLLALIATLAGGYQVGKLFDFPFISWVNPFQYIFPRESVLYQNKEVFFHGIPVTIVLMLLFLIVSSFKIQKEKAG